MSKLDTAYDVWRVAPFSPERPAGSILSDREIALTKQAFEGGVRAVLAFLSDPIAMAAAPAWIPEHELATVRLAIRFQFGLPDGYG